MLPAIIEQYIQTLLSPQTRRNEAENVRYVLATVRDACDKALMKYDGKRG